MTRYLRRTGYWVLGSAIAMFALNQVNGRLMPFHAGDPEAGYTMLIGGDSRSVATFDTIWFPNSRHVGMNAEPFSFTYYKMRYLVDNIPGIEMIMVPFGPHNFAPFSDYMLDGDRATEEIFDNLYGFAPALEMGMPVDFEVWAAKQARYMWTPNWHLIEDWWAFRAGRASERSHPYTRGFQRGVSRNVRPETIRGRLERLFPDSLEGQISTTQPPYIDSLVTWTRAAGIRLVMVSTPLHEGLRNATPGYVMEAFQEKWNRISTEPHVTLLDYTTLPLPDSLFRDPDHVNGPGADIVGQLIRDALYSDSTNIDTSIPSG